MRIYKIIALILCGLCFNLNVLADEVEVNNNKDIEIITPSIEEAIQSLSSEENKTIEGSVSQEPGLNLDECIKIALANNPQIQSAIHNKEIYKTKIGQAWANYFPELSGSIGYQRTKMLMPALSSFKMQPYNYINTVSVSATQLVYDFGKTRTSANVAKKTFEATEKNLDEVINTVVYSVKAAYYNLLFAMQQEGVLKESVKIYEAHLAQAKSYYDIGVKAKIDVITAEHNLSSVKLSHIKSKECN
ncbi:MAG: TolC family protein [Candidatus Melainabacteria bacterium]|nr:MAG: TolC family protein [Candidatus Melainabacteria bacterium]